MTRSFLVTLFRFAYNEKDNENAWWDFNDFEKNIVKIYKKKNKRPFNKQEAKRNYIAFDGMIVYSR